MAEAPKTNQVPTQPAQAKKPSDSPSKTGDGPLSEVKRDREERQKQEARMRELEENLKPGQILTKDQLEEEREKAAGKDKTKPTHDKAGQPLEPGSRVLIEATVTKAENGEIEAEIADPDGKPIKVSGRAGLFGHVTYNPRIGANPQKRGPGIREVPVKGGGIRPVSKRIDDNKSIMDISEQAWDRARASTPVHETRDEQMKAVAKGAEEQRKAESKAA
jgi:hypothetical protein